MLFRSQGVELTDRQNQTLMDGGDIYLENMDKSDGSGKFSSFVFLNDERNRVFFSKEHPDTFVKYGKYEMRLRDKMQVEAGHITRAKVKYWGGGYAQPYLWKTNKSDTDYNESWSDPRLPKPEKPEKQQPTIKKPKQGRGM